MRLLIVNADDFGQSQGINRGIIEAHERGIVTSASLMVRGSAAAEAAAYAKHHPALSIGIHVDLGEWQFDGENWKALYQRVNLDDGAAVRAELGRQIGQFCELMGREPTHIDSHQHVHLREPARAIFLEASHNFDVPLRQLSAIQYCGEFYGQSAEGLAMPELISVTALTELIHRLPAGLTELACHPGYANHDLTSYRNERALEIAALCDPQLRATLNTAGVELCSFSSAPVRARWTKPGQASG